MLKKQGKKKQQQQRVKVGKLLGVFPPMGYHTHSCAGLTHQIPLERIIYKRAASDSRVKVTIGKSRIEHSPGNTAKFTTASRFQFTPSCSSTRTYRFGIRQFNRSLTLIRDRTNFSIKETRKKEKKKRKKETRMIVVKYSAIFLFGLIALGAIYVDGFPDGAPVDVCVKPKPNRPYHGQAEPQLLANNPYQITASSGNYGPGNQITVTIRGSSFKGFFLQARDSRTDSWIGTWAQTPNTNVHDECSAITHADPRDKQEATLIWNAPSNAQGKVYFTGSILKDYATFWADLVAQSPQ